MFIMVIRMAPVAAVCASQLAKVIRETNLFQGVVKNIVVPTASVLLSFDTGRRTLGTYGLQFFLKHLQVGGYGYVCSLSMTRFRLMVPLPSQIPPKW